MLYGSLWGSIQGSGWDMKNANVVCRQLGYEGALMALKYGSSIFGEGHGPVWLSNVKCKGKELYLWNCSHSRISGTYVLHDNDAAVVCKSSFSGIPSKYYPGPRRFLALGGAEGVNEPHRSFAPSAPPRAPLGPG